MVTQYMNHISSKTISGDLTILKNSGCQKITIIEHGPTKRNNHQVLVVGKTFRVHIKQKPKKS